MLIIPNKLDPAYNKAGHFKFADANNDQVIDSRDRDFNR